jgi:hypothetical protein
MTSMTDVTVYTPVETIVVPLSPTEQYELLIQRLVAIRSQRASNAHIELIRAKYEAGQAIALSPLYEGPGLPGSGKLLLKIGRDLNWSQSEMYSCLKFSNEVEDLDEFVARLHAPSWTKIKHRLNTGLPRKKTRGGDVIRGVEPSDRTKAVHYTSGLVGKVWTEAHQRRLERLLNMVLTKSESS